MNTNRPPAVAGMFYPAVKSALADTVTGYLADTDSEGLVPKAIIAPHAGYIYSGPIAASAYKRLLPAKHKITRVVLIGPSHRVAFDGLALCNHQGYSTPLGLVPLDADAMECIAHLEFVHYLNEAHQFEHSLEVHLPFLQTVLDTFSLLPIVVGNATFLQIQQVLEIIWGGPETLIVVSSDLSHYLDYNSAKLKDADTSKIIENLDYDHLSADSACGKIPVSGLMAFARQRHLQIKTIDLRNSGDTAGDKRQVVGYGAYVIES